MYLSGGPHYLLLLLNVTFLKPVIKTCCTIPLYHGTETDAACKNPLLKLTYGAEPSHAEDMMSVGLCRYGIRGLLVDPYNELDHQRPSHMSETEYVSQMLTKIKRFAQHHDVHVWFVAHPRQLRDWKGQPPTMYDISGSAHFINKADNGLVIHRNRDPQAGPMNEVSSCSVADSALGQWKCCHSFERVPVSAA